MCHYFQHKYYYISSGDAPHLHSGLQNDLPDSFCLPTDALTGVVHAGMLLILKFDEEYLIFVNSS